MASEPLITFSAYYLLIFQISLILIILPRQPLSQQVTGFLWKVELPFSMVHILQYSEYFSALREKKNERKKPWGEDSAIKKKATVNNIDYFSDISPLVTVTVFFES